MISGRDFGLIYIQVNMIVTHGNVFKLQKVLYKIKQLVYIILKMKV